MHLQSPSTLERQRQSDPWGSMASSLLGELQVSERPCYEIKQGRKNEGRGVGEYKLLPLTWDHNLNFLPRTHVGPLTSTYRSWHSFVPLPHSSIYVNK